MPPIANLLSLPFSFFRIWTTVFVAFSSYRIKTSLSDQDWERDRRFGGVCKETGVRSSIRYCASKYCELCDLLQDELVTLWFSFLFLRISLAWLTVRSPWAPCSNGPLNILSLPLLPPSSISETLQQINLTSFAAALQETGLLEIVQSLPEITMCVSLPFPNPLSIEASQLTDCYGLVR